MESKEVAGVFVDKEGICQVCGYHEDKHTSSGVVPCKRCKTVEMWYDMNGHYCYDCLDVIIKHYDNRNKRTCAHGYTR